MIQFHVPRLGARLRRPRRATIRILTISLIAAVAVPLGAQSGSADTPSLVFSGAPGTSAPPSTLGSFTMTPFAADTQATGTSVGGVTGPTGPITFSPSLTHFTVGNGWATWSNGYTGDVYATLGPQTATVTLPAGTNAFYLYAEPDTFSTFSVTATAQDGTSSGPVDVQGQAGAAYFGFYGTGGDTVSSITITTAGNDFAIGEFGINGSSLALTGLRFAPTSAQDNPQTPGVPVVKDDGPSPVEDHSFGPASCADGLSGPSDYDYVDCASPPSGTPTKDWPVVFVAGSTLTVDQAVFYSTTDMTGAQLTATATISGQSLKLAATALTSTKVGNAYELTASGLSFTGTLPASPGVDTLSITWSITPASSGGSGGGPKAAGVSNHQIYVTAAAYTIPGTPHLPPYISVLDVGTKAAAGLTDPQAIFNAVWAKFASLSIAHPVLDPATGLTSDGPVLAYYTNGYTTIADWWNHSIGACPAFTTFLAQNSGHCGNWAQYLTYVLGYQGIASQVVNLGQSSFYEGPAPAHGVQADGAAYMLVGPKLWAFKNPTAAGPYSYDDPVTVSGGNLVISGSEITYAPSSTPISQGGISTPPELFFTGDHAIVRTQWGYIDPSYGNPAAGATPYPTIKQDYEPTAIAGFGVFYALQNGTWKVVPWADGATLDTICSTYQCEFRATPLS